MWEHIDVFIEIIEIHQLCNYQCVSDRFIENVTLNCQGKILAHVCRLHVMHYNI